MSNSNELPLGQRRLLENLEQTQERIHSVVNSCMERLASEEMEDLDTLRETLLQQPQSLDESQRRILLGSLFNDLVALRYRQQDLIRQIDEYLARSVLPGQPNPQPLLKFGWQIPSSLQEERKIGQQLTQFILYGSDPNDSVFSTSTATIQPVILKPDIEGKS